MQAKDHAKMGIKEVKNRLKQKVFEVCTFLRVQEILGHKMPCVINRELFGAVVLTHFKMHYQLSWFSPHCYKYPQTKNQIH